MNKMKVTTLCAALLVAGLAGCDASDDDLAASPDLVPPAATEPATELPAAGGEGVLTVGTAGDGGTYITDSSGNAVYMLEAEEDGVDACVGDCLEAWPPVLVTDVQPSIDLGTDLDPTLLGTVERDDGTLQVTYAGHPLYRYAADTGANRIAGQGIDDQWGEWYLVTPTGEEFGMGTTADATMIMDGEVEADSSVAEDATRDEGPADTSAIEEGTADEY
ncbi:MAG TPA: hypothetical protein VFM73_03285 [Xanthomonadaceae bacterium]|nr:hypothetical protein [Xanthomonadaceae bacterium]